ncbi:hypothetical protein OG345_19600 [Streptomyces sp. NBC_01220]|uniref:hypothetical protein n=1 Tax=unclassified Streptomyces TaxID=2593676 RepID=UPI002E2E6507|nr:hypothetical protein [Streptomyces sp. NBC_00184]WSQ45040.1 hypothetical protein OG345_19600 [Streptomyces sp. NBC_01220]
MNRQTPRSAAALYGSAVTSAIVGALLWLRSRNNPADHLLRYGSSSWESDGHTPSAWRIWSPAMTEERLGMYLLAAALVMALAARLVATWREGREGRQVREVREVREGTVLE